MFLVMSPFEARMSADWRSEPWLDVDDSVGDDRFQFVVAEQTMEPVENVLRYLCDLLRVERVSIATERARANDLYEWLMYRHECGRDLGNVEVDDLIDYRDRLLTKPSPKTGVPLEPTTVRRRLSSIISFYQWASDSGRITNDIGKVRVRLRSTKAHRNNMLAHLGGAVTTRNILMPKAQQRLPEFIGDDTLQALFMELGSDPLKGDGRPSRDWLIAYLALLTGMRRSEICALTIHQFRGLHATEESPARLPLSVTKGSKPRTVAIDTFVLDRVLAYIDGERKTVLRRAKSKGRFRHREPIELFLNGPHCADKYIGNPITPDMVDRIFMRAQRTVLGESTKGHSFHHLRHTHVMRRRLAGDEWENISRDVGHAQIGTTINTYARALNQVEPEVRARFVSALRRLAEDDK